MALEEASRSADVPPIFRLRDMHIEPKSGAQRGAHWLQYIETLQLRLPLAGQEWQGVQEADFVVKVCEDELSIRCLAEGDPGGLRKDCLEEISRKLKDRVDPRRCWYAVERACRGLSSNMLPGTRTLVIELAKEMSGKPWPKGVLSEDLFKRRYFGWNPDSQAPPEPTWVTLPPGRRQDVEDPFVLSRDWLCTELEQAQSAERVTFRVVLDEKRLNTAMENVPYNRLFGLDIAERSLKLFIRGDEGTPVLLGDLGGSCLPALSSLELSSFTREVPGHRVRGTMETLPCLELTVYKAPESRHKWEQLFTPSGETLKGPVGSLEDVVRQRLRSELEPEESRHDWTPDDWADEQKAKADAAFKEGKHQDAIVYYTRALRYTPMNERLLANRSVAYLKLSKFQAALDDACKAQELEAEWPKAYFRKGQALRCLRRWDDAVAAFLEGQQLDAENPDWDREVEKTRLDEARWAKRRAAKADS